MPTPADMPRHRQLTVACPTPRKARYVDEARAEAALRKIRFSPTRTPIVPNRVYLCPCGGYHLTNQLPR